LVDTDVSVVALAIAAAVPGIISRDFSVVDVVVSRLFPVVINRHS
jgi:hypothetical protein